MRVFCAILRSGAVLLCAHVVHAQWINTIDAPDSSRYGGFGASISDVPDLDGDHNGDLAIGAAVANAPGADGSGAVFVYSGHSASYLYTLYSPNPIGYGYFGSSIAGIGDLDGDGRGDIVLGAPGEWLAYVFSGATGALIRTLSSPNSGAAFGSCVAAVPDADGDGVPDICVGAIGEAAEHGRAYLFSGATGALLHVFVSPFPRPGGAGFFGGGIAGVPDTDGDGFGDVLIVAGLDAPPGFPDARGRAYLFSGHTGELLYAIDAPRQPTLSFGSVARASADLDGDGRGDLIISDPDQAAPGDPPSEGYVHVFSGATGRLLYSQTSPLHQNEFGFDIAPMPDIDDDGRADLLIGDPFAAIDGQPANSGIVYILSGSTGNILRVIPCQEPTPPLNPDVFGATVAVIQDASGDGRPDFAIFGAGCHQPCSLHPPGRVYIFMSCPADLDYSGIVSSDDFFGFLAAFFSGAGRADINRDGVINSQDFFDFLSTYFAGCP